MSATPARLLLGLIIATPFVLAMALLTGSVEIGVGTLFGSSGNPTEHAILELRWPRVFAAFAVGGCLALAGALIQVLVRNPLGDPYVLGISGGASLAAMLALAAGATGAAIHGAAFGGALAAMVLVFVVAWSERDWSATRLLLTGVLLGTAWGAGITLALTLAPDTELRGMMFWLMGDLSFADDARWSWIALVLGLVVALAFARDLQAMAQGELPAAALGVNTARVRRAIYLTASLLAAVAVTSAGNVGFVGLAAPHIARRVLGNEPRTVTIGTVFIGGLLVLIADTAARTLFAPTQLPVGVVTTLIGVPLFLHLLRTARP